MIVYNIITSKTQLVPISLSFWLVQNYYELTFFVLSVFLSFLLSILLIWLNLMFFLHFVFILYGTQYKYECKVE